MIYAYKIENNNIVPLGSSDTEERMARALELAGIDTEDVQYTETELVCAGNKWYLSADDEEYIALKAIDDENDRIAGLQPTLEERVSANEDAIITQMEINEMLVVENEELKAENEALNDTMLELIEQFETAISAE